MSIQKYKSLQNNEYTYEKFTHRPARNIIRQADDFAEAYRRCMEGKTPKKENGRLCFSVVSIPAIVNASFACELYMKSLLEKKPQEHNLWQLFNLLSERDKRIIKEYVDDKLNTHPIYSFEFCLERVADVFVNWRYIYEKEHTDGFYGSYINEFLMFFEHLMCILQKLTREI